MMIDHQNSLAAVQDMFNDMLQLDIGTPTQRQTAIRSLWDTHQGRLLTYMFFGDSQIITDITNDVTHGWLDTIVGSQSVRAHVVDRLTAGLQ